MPRQRGLTRRLARFGAWGTTLLACWMLALLLLQVLFGRQLERIQTLQLGRDLALNIRLSELTLERHPPITDQRAHGPGAPGELTTSGGRSRGPSFGPAAPGAASGALLSPLALP